MNTKLYIIGNGFDIYHGINSRYSDFKDYVEKNDIELFNTLEEYFDTDELWADFEETLAYIDTDTITDDASNYLVSYGADDWSEADHHNYSEEIKRAIDIITVQLREHFTNWVLKLNKSKTPLLSLDKNSNFLSFNYTDTLESTYNIARKHILYIHNKAIDQNSVLILGHSRLPSDSESFSSQNDEDTDTRVAEGNYILDQYFEDTYKNTTTIIEENEDFFNELKGINEIFVLGHSISAVDIEYFKIIKDKIDGSAIWIVDYFGIPQKQEKYDRIAELGVSTNNGSVKNFV